MLSVVGAKRSKGKGIGDEVRGPGGAHHLWPCDLNKDFDFYSEETSRGGGLWSDLNFLFTVLNVNCVEVIYSFFFY